MFKQASDRRHWETKVKDQKVFLQAPGSWRVVFGHTRIPCLMGRSFKLKESGFRLVVRKIFFFFYNESVKALEQVT